MFHQLRHSCDFNSTPNGGPMRFIRNQIWLASRGCVNKDPSTRFKMLSMENLSMDHLAVKKSKAISLREGSRS